MMHDDSSKLNELTINGHGIQYFVKLYKYTVAISYVGVVV